MPPNNNFLGGPVFRRERNIWNTGSSIDKEADLVHFKSKYHSGLLCFYGEHRSLYWRPWDPSLGGRLWPWLTWELRTVCHPMISPEDGAGSQRWVLPGALPPKMACLSTLITCPWVWILPWGNLSEWCDQDFLPFILSLFPLQTFLLFF
jgi:hypothetical protein